MMAVVWVVRCGCGLRAARASAGSRRSVMLILGAGLTPLFIARPLSKVDRVRPGWCSGGKWRTVVREPGMPGPPR